MRRGWSLSIRSWLAIALVVVILAPFLAWLGTIALVRGPAKSRPDPWTRQSQEVAEQAITLIRTRPEQWGDAVFQGELTALLVRGGLSGALVSPEGRLLYRSGRMDDRDLTKAGEQASWIPVTTGFNGSRFYLGSVPLADGRSAGTFLLVVTRTSPIAGWILLAAIAGLTLAAGGVVWLVSRAVSRPVLDLAQAAHLVKGGELGFSVPASRVRELNDLGRAFSGMRDGLRTAIAHQAFLEEDRRLMVAGLAHDLRTPLSSVRGYLEGLRDGVANTPEKVARYLAVALEKTESLERLVASLLAYTRAAYGQQPPSLEPVQVEELMESAVTALRPGAEAKGLALHLEGDPICCVVQADRQMLSRVVENLLENGLRYTPVGGRITLGWRCGPAVWQFWVRDSGPGIAEADLGRVFDPFYRGDQARGSQSGGTGLGLAVARQLVEAHGGRIAATNEGGACFRVTLPLRPERG